MVFQVQMVYQETVVPKVRLVTKVIVPSYPCPIWVEKEKKEPKEIKELGEKTQDRLMVKQPYIVNRLSCSRSCILVMRWSIRSFNIPLLRATPRRLNLLKFPPPGGKLCSNAPPIFFFFVKGKINDRDFLHVGQALKSRNAGLFFSIVFMINLLTLSDQDRISPYNFSTISSRQVMRIKKNIN